MIRAILLVSLVLVVACGSIATDPPDAGHTESSSTSSTAHGGSGGGMSTSTGGSGGQTTTTVQCDDPEHPKAPCVLGGCQGTCFPPAVLEDGGILPGVCQIEDCAPVCFLDADCAPALLFPGPCEATRCDPTGKTTTEGSHVKGCYLVSTENGKTCGYVAGGVGICDDGTCVCPGCTAKNGSCASGVIGPLCGVGGVECQNCGGGKCNEGVCEDP